ncbi:MAG: leucine-rich repeat protein, partial [Oscillospiraceae bacterium]|nr:leucine-rich repeat protein [Oscillospiraceae bacterium]
DMNDQINTLAAGWMTEVNKCSTDAEKVIKMAQLIADHTEYRSERDTEGKLYQTIMAVFIYQKAVCTSYAKSLLYLCDLAGIEGIVVTSKKSEAEAHAWTRLKLDGKWYEADPTWYDQTEHGLGYWDMWMNKSTATITAGDDLHYINTDFALYYGLTLPECNEDYNGEGPGPGPDPTSGKCGDNAEWEYEDSVLTITGSGDTDSFTDGVPWAAYADSITSVVIEGVSSVGDSAFSGCTGLRSVTLPDTLTSIGDKAFRGCAGITALSLPASLSPADIGEDAFAGCTGLSHIHIPYGSDVSDYTGTGGLPADADLYHVLTVSGYCDDISCPYGKYGHEDDDGKCGDDMTWEYSGGTLTITGSGDMYDYNGDDMPWKEYSASITELSLPDGLTYIGKNAFAGLTGVSVLTINHPVTIGEDAFSGCTGLSHIHIPAGTADVYTGNYGLPADSTIYHELSENGCDDINCPAGLYDYSRVTVSFEVRGVFGGRVVTFNSSVPDARIYFSSQTSRPTEGHQNVQSGESVLFEDFYGTIYARTFINGVWGTSSRLILKIPVVKDPEISVSGNTAVISTVTPDCYIIYTTDGTAPALDNGKRVFGRASVDITAVPRLRAIAVRNCFTNSNEVEKTFDIRVSPPAFAVKGVFGGREVTFTTDTPGAVIYYTTENRSVLTTSDKHVQSGDTVLFTSYYGTVYARAYLNGKWSNVSKLILKIPTVSKVEAEQVRNTVYLKSSTPDSYIIYTTDGTTPSYGHGKMGKGTVQVALKPNMKIRVIAVRSGFSNSRELEINVR